MKLVVPNNGKNFTTDDHRLANHLSSLLHKVLNYHEVDGLADMVLHELGHDDCFGLNKATYLVDNPDFNHLLGVAGYHKEECLCHKEDIWVDPYVFKNDMKKAQYHNEVKKFLRDSLRRKDVDFSNANDVEELAENLGIKDAHYFTWNMKHGNHGLIIFEKGDKSIDEWREGLLANVAGLLSFCGI